jgi:hypothetical protein
MKMMLALLALIPIQAQAADEVTIETFESRAIGSGSFNIHNSAFMFNTRLSGGQVAAAMPASAAHSGVQVYTGTSIGLRTEDKTLFSWPGVGAWVSGVDTIWLQAYEYDQATGLENALALVSVAGGVDPVYLSIGSFDEPHFITSATFYSDSRFAIDDLTLGIEGIGPGIPEPASWALMLFGFGSIGASMRYRLREKTVA